MHKIPAGHYLYLTINFSLVIRQQLLNPRILTEFKILLFQ